MLPSALLTASAYAISTDFGAESSRPASLLCTLRTHQSPGEWQHSLLACSLALARRDFHPLDFFKWFPLRHFWFLHLHAFPSAIGACPSRCKRAGVSASVRLGTQIRSPDCRPARLASLRQAWRARLAGSYSSCADALLRPEHSQRNRKPGRW